MSLLVFSLSLGSLCLWPDLLPGSWLIAAWCLALAALLWPSLIFFNLTKVRPAPAIRRGILQGLFAALAGVSAAQLHGAHIVQSQLPAACDQQAFRIEGQVVDLPNQQMGRVPFVSFQLRVKNIKGLGQNQQLATQCKPHAVQGERVQLYLYESEGLPKPQNIKAGQHLSLEVVLKRPRGLINPASQDYQLRLLRQGVMATGIVRQLVPLPDARPGFSVDVLRAAWREKLTRWVADPEVVAVMAALSIGSRQGLSENTRTLLTHTGTGHLLAISGLHVGMMALVGYGLGRLLFALCVALFSASFYTVINGRLLAAVVSVICAGGYAGLSGFALPTQRALIMVCLVYIAQWVARYWALLDVWLVALALVLLINPLQAADAGLYLSFGAVWALMMRLDARHNQSHHWVGKISGWFLPQWWVFLGLIPLTILFWQGVSSTSVVANSIAIPWVTLITVPVVLLAFVLQWLPLVSEFLVSVCAASIESLLAVLAALAAIARAWGWLVVSLPAFVWLLVFFAVALLFVPLPVRVRIACLVCLAFASLLHTGFLALSHPARQRITVFDVGQGLAVLMEIDGRVILYDTGPPLGNHTNAAEHILLPYLVARGINRLDLLIVSHGDADHASGVQTLISQLKVDTLWFGEPLEGFGLGAMTQPNTGAWPAGHMARARNAQNARTTAFAGELGACHGKRWAGASGLFTLSALPRPVSQLQGGGNNASCVVLLVLPGLSVLIPGDIDKSAELSLNLPAHNAGGLQLLVAPHHGSKSSSSFGLLGMFQPSHVIVSAGYRNRYGHPHEDVVARAQLYGAMLLNTATSGAIEYHWQAGEPGGFRTWRNYQRRFWHHR
ncbi:DNA internalization-related competence protein ComEC/Rec2 [Simiduia sp. 21SJ11W-1]|uniref:DNA internalization-related competence protein ComEC/Rec2 n=1 Tax=Simiduia sp. 21SJ11W-1 TaxID=2909669 RepID=UPI0020A1CC70|nr:DNA internalization-related competence protein ComEC/Rec2 [Simiduia sp. 21SJ11W-1]UTA49436.1 DNA internalization-related competence protein ComEC/Rec2 [Simiduia sp. 21SJ11W-1]